MNDKGPEEWTGRSETARDTLSADVMTRLNATLDLDVPAVAPGEVVFPLAHWLHFLPRERQSGLGPDGHAARGGFLPPIHDLPRRMWAGSRLDFHGELHAGMELERTSTIASVAAKQGAGGPLVFVTVRHEIGEPGGAVLLTDEHDIVYRSAGGPAVRAAPSAPAPGHWQRKLVPDAVLLFRYSALTFNGHRIHYDRTYVTQAEGYPGLIVHGPLIATLLLDHAMRHGGNGKRSTAFSFRALSPLFDGNEMTLHANEANVDGTMDVWATNHEGGLAMKAQARFGR